jgi:DNA-binding transcriptional LysR family regulator
MKEQSPVEVSRARHVSLRQLRYFVAVADHRSFRRAAESLSISQPPVSKQVQELERALGVPLIERSKRRFALTLAGEAFWTEARMLLAGLDRACDTIRALHCPAPRTFLIGMADDFVYSPHFEILLSAAAELGISICTTVGLSPAIELQVAHGIVDAALINLPLSSEPAGLVVRPIAPSRICLLVPRKHPLARRSAARPATLQGVPLVICADSPPNAFASQCEKLFVMAGVTPTISCRSTSTAITELLVERGAGVGIVSEYSVRPDNPRLKLVPIESEQNLYRHAVAYRADCGGDDLTGLLGALKSDEPRGSDATSYSR